MQRIYSSAVHHQSSEHLQFDSPRTTATSMNENSGHITIKIEGFSMPFNLPFNSRESILAMINVLNLLANKFELEISTKDITKKEPKGIENSSSNEVPQEPYDPLK